MQCKSLAVCRGKMSLCAFMIMCVQRMILVDFFSKSVHFCVCVCVCAFKGGREQVEAACVCPGETDTPALSPTARDMRR